MFIGLLLRLNVHSSQHKDPLVERWKSMHQKNEKTGVLMLKSHLKSGFIRYSTVQSVCTANCTILVCMCYDSFFLSILINWHRFKSGWWCLTNCTVLIKLGGETVLLPVLTSLMHSTRLTCHCQGIMLYTSDSITCYYDTQIQIYVLFCLWQMTILTDKKEFGS